MQLPSSYVGLLFTGDLWITEPKNGGRFISTDTLLVLQQSENDRGYMQFICVTSNGETGLFRPGAALFEAAVVDGRIKIAGKFNT